MELIVQAFLRMTEDKRARILILGVEIRSACRPSKVNSAIALLFPYLELFGTFNVRRIITRVYSLILLCFFIPHTIKKKQQQETVHSTVLVGCFYLLCIL
jgi:hypothetical protein